MHNPLSCACCLYHRRQVIFIERCARAATQYRLETAVAEARFQAAYQSAMTGSELAHALEERRSAIYRAFRDLRTEREEAEQEFNTGIC